MKQLGRLVQMTSAVMLGLLSFRVTAADAPAELTPIVPLSYTFNRETIRHPQETAANPIYADPGFQALTDGDWSAKARRVVWQNKGWPGGGVLDLHFSFAQPFELRRVVVHSLRRRGYAVKRLQVFGVSEGAQRLLGDETLNQSWAYPPEPDMPPTKMLALQVPCEPHAVSAVRVRIDVVSFLGLAEIQFLGIPPQAMAEPAPGPASYVLPEAADDTPLRVVTGDFNSDGYEDFLLENAQVAYVVEPRWGGVVNMALNKRTGINLVKPNVKGSWGGLFADRMYATQRTDFFGQPYSGEIAANTPARAAVRVSGRGSTGQYLNVTFEKTFSLLPESWALRADYRVRNGADNVVAVTDGVWVLNGVGSASEATRMFWADGDGPQVLGNVNTKYVYAPTRGWLGMVTESGSGIALVCDYRRTAGFLFWRSGDFATTEFKMGRYPIEAGAEFTMTAWAVPFDGVGAPDGASPDMVGSLELAPTLATAPEKLVFTLRPNHAGTFQIDVAARRLPETEWNPQHTATVTLEPEPTPLETPLDLPGPGTWVVRVQAAMDGEKVFEMERATVMAKSTAPYVMAPETQRFLPENPEDKGGRIDYHALDYETEHVPWAKPWFGGKPRVLFLPRRRAGIREVVELAQRFEMDAHTSYMPRTLDAGCSYDLADFAARLNSRQLLAALEKRLGAEETLDAIVVAGDLWRDLSAELQAQILDRVRAGAGLVLLAPEYVPDALRELVALDKPEAAVSRFRGAWRGTAEHFITDGIPFAALPATLALPYRLGGERLADIGDHPLVGIGTLGKGRVAVGTWVVAGLSRNVYHRTHGGVGLLPNMLALGNDAPCENHYWEYQMSLLMRMIYWAARCETGVRGSLSIDPVERDGTGRATVLLRDTSGRNLKLALDWTLRDRFSRILDTGTTAPVQLDAREKRIPIAFQQAFLEGPVFLEAVARVDGQTVWWGTATAAVEADARIDQIELAQRVWQREGNIGGILTCTGNSTGLTVRIAAVDAQDRIWAQDEMPARERLEFQLPLRDSLGLTGHVVACLFAEGRVVSERRAPFVVAQAPDTRRMQVAFGWPSVSYGGHRRFLHRHYYGRLQYLGATAVRVQHVGAFEWFEARSLGLTTLKSSAGAGFGGKHPNQRDPGKGKWGLIRSPCLSEPGFMEKLVAANAQPSAFEDVGVLYRGLGDELNSISNWDGCFSAACQVAFRQWLRTQYGDLPALNRSWRTTHTDWDAVVAMTLEEVQAHPSFAPWLDHRLFNNWNWARSFGAVLEGTHRVNPALRVGFSGTQETKPWNAYDWWQLCQSVGAVAAYGGEQVVQRRSFADDMYSMSWIGYTSPLDDLRSAVITKLLEGDRGFSVFSGRFMVDPDYTIPERAEWLRHALGSVGGGRAEVIIGTDYDAGPIAVHYSPASVSLGQALGIDALRLGEVKGIRELLLAQSADYNYIAYAQLEQGEVQARTGRPYKLVFLPASTAMSDAECRTLRDWVRAGGILVGGFGTATFTGHGAPRGAGALDEVFGLHRADAQFRTGTVQLTGTGSACGITLAELALEGEALETGIRPDTAEVVGWAVHDGSRHPAILVNRYGSGIAVYLAADALGTYGVWGATRALATRRAAAAALDRFAGDLLETAGIAPRPVPRDDTGKRLACTRLVFRRHGPLELIGIVRDTRNATNLDAKPHQVTLRLDGPRHLYELLARTYAGQTDTYRETFTPNTHRVLALLPYQVQGLRLETSATTTPAVPGSSVAVRLALQARAEAMAVHPVAVAVHGPDGSVLPGYPDLVFLREGAASFSLPLPLNAAAGEWRVDARDAISNTAGSVSFQVAD